MAFNKIKRKKTRERVWRFLVCTQLEQEILGKKLVDFANIQVKKKKKEVLKVASKRIVQTSAEAVRLHHRETNRD